jgi:hypothetical protein
MRVSKTMVIVRQVYDWIESALWAILAAWVICFLIFVAPNLPAMARRAEAIRELKERAENRAYCEKWGMKEGSQDHALCIMDLRALRKKIEQDFAQQGDIF